MASQRVPVRFEAEGAGDGELSWGQRELWTAIRRQRNWLPIGAVLPLPPGITIGEVAADLRFLIERFPTLRTRLRFGPGGVRQVVSAAGEVRVEVVDAADREDPAAVGERVRLDYQDADYDFATEWPVRAAVIRHRGALTHQVLVMCHLVTDGPGAAIMVAELAAFRSAGRDRAACPPAPPGTLEPLAQARWQTTPAAGRLTENALRYWEKILRGIEPDRFRGSDDPRKPRHWQGRFSSPAMSLAVPVIAARTRTDTSAVLLALFAAALARLTGIDPVVVQVVVGNRFRPGLAGTVSPVNQTGLCVLEVTGNGMDEVVGTARRRLLAAYKYAYYDPYRLDELIARVGQERGVTLDLACYFNDRREPLPGQPPVATPARLRAALPRSTFVWERREDYSFERLFVHVDERPGRIEITVCGDTHFVAPADLEACVRGMEELAVAAVLDPAGTAGAATAGAGARGSGAR